MRPTLRAGAAALAAGLALLLVTATAASAAVSFTASLQMPGMAAGMQDMVGSFTVANTNSAPNATESSTVTELRMAISCATTPTGSNLCSQPDDGVFAFSPSATGAAGTSCAGTPFTVSAPDSSAIVTFTKSGGPLVLPPPGGSPGANSCQVNFTFDVLKVPALDASPAAEVQTRQNLVVTMQASTSGIVVSAALTLASTVFKAWPTLSTVAADGVVGLGAITDRATITSDVPAGVTGTVTFRLYGAGDTTCAASAVFTSVRPISGAGIAQSLGYQPPVAGSYRWRASYSGDANHDPIDSFCNEVGETSVVGAAAQSATTGTSATGDFDNDGFDDLVVAAPHEDSGAAADSGAVHVLYGGAAGASAAGSQYWSQNSSGIADTAEAGDGFGSVLTAGDLNGDGRDDLAIGVPGESVGAVADAGVVHVLYGSASGLVSAGSQLWSQSSSQIADSAEADDGFGGALATGRLDNDAFAELVVGAPGESLGTIARAGVVHVIRGAAGGLTATGSQYWSQDSGGILDSAETGDGFGASLAIGDVKGSLGHDLAIGASNEDAGAVVDGGAVHVLYGSATGLSATGSQYWTQNAAGIADGTETGDRFGSVLATGSLDGDAFDELVVGVPDENAGAVADSGVVHVIAGASSGLTATRSAYWFQGSGSLVGVAEAGDRLGASLAVGELTGAGGRDMAIGMPGQDLGAGAADAGQVYVLYFSVGTLGSALQQDWFQNSDGLGDVRETGDRFGSALAVGSLDGGAFGDLVVGVPGESVGAVAAAGLVHVLPGGAGGVSSTGSQTWTQNSAGVADGAETGDGFGAALSG